MRRAALKDCDSDFFPRRVGKLPPLAPAAKRELEDERSGATPGAAAREATPLRMPSLLFAPRLWTRAPSGKN